MTFGKENTDEPCPRYDDEPDWDDVRLCPECEGRGYLWFKDKRDIEVWGEKELCMTCDGLGVIYEDR